MKDYINEVLFHQKVGLILKCNMFKFFAAFSLFLIISTTSTAITGCIDVARTRIYTNQHPSGYWRTNTFSTAQSGCFYVYTGAICSIGFIGANNGYLGDTSNPQECPIDDYIWIMVVLVGDLGYCIIRRRNMQLAIA